jgi:conjugal transfer pilin signal peptidase TrbI
MSGPRDENVLAGGQGDPPLRGTDAGTLRAKAAAARAAFAPAAAAILRHALHDEPGCLPIRHGAARGIGNVVTRTAARLWHVTPRVWPGWGFVRRAGLVSALVAAAELALAGRWRISWDPQVTKCLPGLHLAIVDLADRSVAHGAIVAFRAEPEQAPFPPGALIGKVVLGLPGDRVAVTPDQTTVNGVVVGFGLRLAGFAHRSPAALARTLVVPRGTVWVMGATADSYDSRYWGPLPLWQVVGRVHVAF